jgi:glycosyltransferase involved in cell wall biosynthesis
LNDRSASTRISAVIPAYNREHTLPRAIESALGQTRPPDEIIVVDDGSTDGTAKVAARFPGAVEGVSQPNRGASEARNEGVRRARSPWIAFLDSDDYWLPDHLERMEHAIDATRGRAAFYFSDLRVTPEVGEGLLWDISDLRIDGPHELSEDASDWAMMRVQPMMLQSSVFRREAYLEAGGLRPSLRCRHDTHLFLKLSIEGPACAVAGCGTVMTTDGVGDERVTSAFGARNASFAIETIEMYADILGHSALPARHAAELRERIANAEMRLAKQAWQERGLGRFAAALGRAAVRSPGTFVRRALRGVRPLESRSG